MLKVGARTASGQDSFSHPVVDDQDFKRKFHISNGITKAKINPFVAQLPMSLFPGWNEIQFNMAELTKKAYGTTFVEVRRIHVHANCRLRRVYFSDKIYADEDLPDEFKLFASDVPLKPGLSGIGSERRADNKIQLDINTGYSPMTLVN
ncbi:hypothetical protein GE061_010824 [Apolygus lucorum]|uniref:CFA20 domain-containing protein n=1 Tax=Apolygus lucorum TaxID=248454 RepID=A0A8S9XX53_APOLU|nr:hypothetical protein GE061_010824 [Apolygus lucorum]